MLDRFRIDDGRHFPLTVIDEDASRGAGAARHRARCSCGWTADQVATSPVGAATHHLAHAQATLRPPKGPAWMPLGVRVALLVVAMTATWGGFYLLGQNASVSLDLSTAQAMAVRAASHLAGLAASGGVMIAARRYIAQARA
ncbi:hypothetical protein [Streptomyces albidoflavus]|uniref:hypothetical protein n=1 Tax=Streptomyces albidoflavus TaxID=1886 RepID=UPI00101EBFA4|nr:hypothetical protein [Streptomyces albidoflavus]RZF02874.1 hypothetical protein C0R05_32180 [Streptomyces albidoflavus]